jgi:hypothetical protein
MNATPILTRYCPAIVEYLGADYPFYFTNREEAERKSQDMGLIVKTHVYLKHMDKTRFTYSYFNDALREIILENV